MFGLDASTYPGHQEWDGINHGIDWWPRGKADMQGAGYTHEDREMLTNFAQAVGALGAGQSGPAAPGVSMLGGMPGMPFTPARFGGGTGGGASYDTQVRDQRAIERAQHDKDIADRRVADAQAAVDKAQQELDDVKKGKTGPLGGTTPATDREIAAAEEKKKKAEEALADAKWEQSEREKDIADATRKQAEDLSKPPSQRGDTGRASSEYESITEQFASGLLKGFGEAIGLPNLGGAFGDMKMPWDWGAWKIGAGLLNWGMGELNAIAGGGSFKGGMNVGGVNIPQLAPAGNGPNAHMQAGYAGQGPGGPMIGGDYMPTNISVQSAGDAQIAADVQRQQQSWSAAQQTASAPGTLAAYPH